MNSNGAMSRRMDDDDRANMQIAQSTQHERERSTEDGQWPRRSLDIDTPYWPWLQGGHKLARSESVRSPLVHDDTTPHSDSANTSSSSSSATLLPHAPNGGYAWVVVLAAFLVHVIADGVAFSFGVLYPHIQSEFSAEKGEAGVVASVFLAMPLLAGPIASPVIERYGCRPTVIAGGIISALGFFLARYAPNLVVLMLAFMFSGIGFAFTFTGAMVSVTYYFSSKRAVATGLTVCGTGIGTCVFAPIIEALLSTYGWDGALLILSAILLNQCVCGLLMRDLEWPEDTLDYKRDRFIRKMEARNATTTMMSVRTSRRGSRQRHPSDRPTMSGAESHGGRCYSLHELPTYLAHRGTHDGEHDVDGEPSAAPHSTRKSKSVAANLLHLETTSPPVVARLHHLVRGRRRNQSACSHHSVEHMRVRRHGDHVNVAQMSSTSTISLSSVPRTPSVYNRWNSVDIAELGHLVPVADIHEEAIAVPVDETMGRRPRAASKHVTNLISRTPKHPLTMRHYYERRKGHLTMVHHFYTDFIELCIEYVDLVKSFDFALVLLSALLLYTFYDIPYVNVPEHMLDVLDITEKESSAIISIIGIVNTVGMVIYGLVADIHGVDKILLYGASTCCCGLCIVGMPWIGNYHLALVVCGLFGFFISANYTLASVIILELMSLSDFVGAYSLLGFVEGIGTLVGPALAGYLYDWTGSYTATFLVGGLGIMLSGVLMLALAAANIIRDRRRRIAIATRCGVTYEDPAIA